MDYVEGLVRGSQTMLFLVLLAKSYAEESANGCVIFGIVTGVLITLTIKRLIDNNKDVDEMVNNDLM